ncbi:MAG: tetratricopeptide repeat protein [bacterium]|nr:tetratricopeptide repeat protein [bacterium]
MNLKKKLIIFVLVFSMLIIFGEAKKKKNLRPGQLKPGSPEFFLHEGVFYLNNGNTDMAEKKIRLALKKKPEMLAAINALGVVYLNRQNFDKAIAQFKHVLSLNPGFTEAHNYLGVIYSETGEYQLAKEHLLIAANASEYRTPENAFSNLAWLEVRNNKFQSALRYIKKGIDANKNFAPLYNVKGVIYEKMKDYRRALHYYKKALGLLTKDDISFLINIGRVYVELDQKDKALDILERALAQAYNDEIKKQIRELLKKVE